VGAALDVLEVVDAATALEAAALETAALEAGALETAVDEDDVSVPV